MAVIVTGMAAVLGVNEGLAMIAQPTRMAVWKKGESIGGEEFVAASEAIVDYIATLRRPTELMKPVKYDCMAKTRSIRPSVFSTPSTNNAHVYVNTVYELRDCTEVP